MQRNMIGSGPILTAPALLTKPKEPMKREVGKPSREARCLANPLRKSRPRDRLMAESGKWSGEKGMSYEGLKPLFEDLNG